MNLSALDDEELLRHAYNQESVLTPLELELAERLGIALDYIKELEDDVKNT